MGVGVLWDELKNYKSRFWRREKTHEGACAINSLFTISELTIKGFYGNE